MFRKERPWLEVYEKGRVEPETRIGRALAERYLEDGIASVDDPEVAGPAPTASPIGLAAVAGGVVLAVIGLFGAVVLLGRRRAG